MADTASVQHAPSLASLCPSIKAALADTAESEEGAHDDGACPSIKAALADTAREASSWRIIMSVSIDQGRVGRHGQGNVGALVYATAECPSIKAALADTARRRLSAAGSIT